MVYLASSREIALRDSSHLYVEELALEREAVRRWFSLPHVRFIGAHTGCSCGFPSVAGEEPVEYDEKFLEGEGDRADDLASVRALLAVIDDALVDGEAVELLPIWVGDEGEQPLGAVHLVRHLVDPERFFFTENFLYRVTA
jgi:hypothetical protein